jgi:DNA-binding CsgD family transcriptional regulator
MKPQKRWTKEEEKQLTSLVVAGHTLVEIAAELDRNVPAVRKRVYALRLSLKRIKAKAK